MKRFTLSLISSVLALGVLAGCGGVAQTPAATTTTPAGTTAPAPAAVTLKVGATLDPHAKILESIQAKAEAEGIKLEIVEFTDYVQPNLALADKQLDANYFQHVPYLESFSAEKKLELENAGAIHLEPLGLYSTKIGTVAELKDGDTITIPLDPSNAGRALVLLEQQGLIKLKAGLGVKATEADIVENPKNLKIELIDAELLARTLQDVTAAVINGNYYLEAKENLKLEAKTVAIESPEGNPFANVVAVRKGDSSRPEIQKLIKLLQSEDVKTFIESKYSGAVIPAFGK